MTTDQFLQTELARIHVELKKNLGNGIDRLVFDFPIINLSELVLHAACEKIFFFNSKEKDFTFLGLGHSNTLKATELKEFQKTNPDLFLTTDFSFEGDPSEAHFILPEWMFISQNGKTKLIVLKSHEYQNFSSPNLFFNQNFDLFVHDPFLPPWSSYEEFPEHDEWGSMIEKSARLFESGELEKIVLSRKKIFGFSEPLDPLSFFNLVLAKNNKNLSYQIFHQPRFGEAFLSITPEKLFSVEGNLFESISLAGSAPRGSSENEDQELEVLLKTNEKLVREHALVTEEIERLLAPLVNELKVFPLQTMKLPYIQHRSSPIKATLKEAADPLQLIGLLHPTPAVGGLPWNKAKNRLQELEPYQRKYYAAPIGIISATFSEIAVGIRSALIENDQLTLFGGAGIVKGSNAEEEWIETGTKMNPFLQVVNGE